MPSGFNTTEGIEWSRWQELFPLCDGFDFHQGILRQTCDFHTGTGRVTCTVIIKERLVNHVHG